MLKLLTATALLLSAADHWTTYVCLVAPVEGFEVVEANPLAAWLFAQVGLASGLLIDSAVTLTGLTFLASTGSLSRGFKLAFLGILVATTAFAVSGNLEALRVMGISPFPV